MSEWWLVKWLLRRADGDAGYPPRAPRQPRGPRTRIPPHRCEPLPDTEHPETVRCPTCGAWDFTPEERARR